MAGSNEIQTALITRLTAASPGAAVPSASLSVPNYAFTPGSTRWYRATFLPGESVAAAVGVDAQNRHVGIFQVDIFDPKGQGDGLSRQEAERIVSCFKRGTILHCTGGSFIIEKAYRAAGTEEGDWYQTPVIIQWRGDVAN